MRGGKRQGAGRKPSPRPVTFTLRLPSTQAASFRALCANLGLSQSRALAHLLLNQK